MKKYFNLITIFFVSFVYSQENIKYQKPSQEILDLVEYERAPSVLYDDQKTHMIFLYRDNYKTIEDLSAKEMRLGGLRIDPATNIGSRVTYYNNVKIKNLKDSKGEIKQIDGLPQNPKLSNISWSPNQKKVALTNTTRKAWVLWWNKNLRKKIEKYFKIKKEKVYSFKKRIDKFGAFIAFFSWMPILGDILTLSLGFFRVNIKGVFIWMFIGRSLRFIVIAYLIYNGIKIVI